MKKTRERDTLRVARRAVVLVSAFCLLALVKPATAGNLIGYWEGYSTFKLGSVPKSYNIVNVAFALPTGPHGTNLTLVQSAESDTEFKADIALLQKRGQKVFLSIGGQKTNNINVNLQSPDDVTNFVDAVSRLIDTYHFDGIDLDLENGTMNQIGDDKSFLYPTTLNTVNLIKALDQLHKKYPRMGLAFAPETSYIDAYGHWNEGEGWGSYLAILYATRSWLTYVAPQMYNSGDMYGKDGNIYVAGSGKPDPNKNQVAGGPDFLVALADMLISGYTCKNGEQWPGLRPEQVAFGVIATADAAKDNGYLAPAGVRQALDYIKYGKTYEGRVYDMGKVSYPTFGGVMIWSINQDQEQHYPFANALVDIVHGTTIKTTKH